MVSCQRRTRDTPVWGFSRPWCDRDRLSSAPDVEEKRRNKRRWRFLSKSTPCHYPKPTLTLKRVRTDWNICVVKLSYRKVHLFFELVNPVGESERDEGNRVIRRFTRCESDHENTKGTKETPLVVLFCLPLSVSTLPLDVNRLKESGVRETETRKVPSIS